MQFMKNQIQDVRSECIPNSTIDQLQKLKRKIEQYTHPQPTSKVIYFVRQQT